MDDAAIEEAIDGTGLQHVLGAAGLVAVEWWEFYRGPLPQKLVTVEITVKNAEDRSIELKFAGQGLQRALDAVS
jgi:tRNA A37 threonylcarbamoyladenosine biosynthesis protein TsaE